MEFSISFKDKDGDVIYVRGVSLGLQELDLARDFTGLPNLSSDLVWHSVDPTPIFPGGDAKIVISEQVARDSGRFIKNHSFSVRLDDFEDWIKMVPVVSRGSNGEVVMVRFEQKLELNKLLKLWIEKGYPESL